jgi:NAD(P)-dependent dehydrogenase (short-subunit alcohol dehydrogenase family)
MNSPGGGPHTGGSRDAPLSPLSRLFDALAEIAVVPSFSRVGIAVRRRLDHWDDLPRMEGRVVLVTGATSGIGLAAATAFGTLGADVHLVGRDPGRGDAALREVRAAGSGAARLHLADLSEPADVARLADRLSGELDHLDALVHNAGALTPTYQVNGGGIERTVATHVLGPYALTAGLGPLLFAAVAGQGGSPAASDPATPRPPTIVTVSSGGMYAQRFDLSKLESGPAGYDGVTAYARAKRAQLVLARAWAERFAPAGLVSYAMHPGWVDTPGLEAGLPRFRAAWRPLLRTPAEGADTAVWLAACGPADGSRDAASSPSNGGFFHDRRLRPDHRFPVTRPTRPGDGDALLAWCAGRTGIATPGSGELP